MKRSALILLVAGILGLLVFLALRSNDSGRHVVAPEASEGSVATSSESAVVPEPTGAPSDVNERTRVAPLAEPGDAELATGWSVCVVNARTNAPVAGAVVSVNDSNAMARETVARGIGFDTLAGLRLRREHAIEAETGPDGCVHFAAPPKNASVEARHDALFAFTVVNQPPLDGRVTLKLVPDLELRVRVVDPAGTPVGGVPVALRCQAPTRTGFESKWTDTAPTTGIATFLHFQRRLEQRSGWQTLLAFPVRDQQALSVDARTPSEPPLELVLPDTGRVLVRVRAADGSMPELGDAELRIEAFESASRSTPLWAGGPWSTPQLDAAGDARVPWIGVGLFVRATLVREDSVLAAKSIAGPTRAGEEVVCDLDWLERAPYFVTGRFVLRDGRAWPATTVVAQPQIFPTPARWPQSRALDVDARGRFRMQVDEVRPENGSLKFRFTAPHPEGLGEVSALLALEQEIPPEGLELGDVLLDHGVLLAAGRVVDTERRPIAGATVEVHARTIVQDQEKWPRIPTAGTIRTGDDGGFALYLPSGESPPNDELRLRAAAKDCAAEREIDVQLGERGVELVLEHAGALAGSLALERGVAPSDFVLVVGGATRLATNPSSDGSFEVRELLPGTYSLEVKRLLETGADRAPAAVVKDLVVRAGETCRDPRIQGLRIGSALTTLRIRIVDRASAPLAHAAVSIVGGTAARSVLCGNDGVALVRYETLPVDLEVAAFGFARQRLVGVSSDCEVVLDAGFPIRLRTSAQMSGAAPRYLVYVRLYSVGAEGATGRPAWGPEFDYASYDFDEHGELALRMPEAGLYECEVHVSVLRDDRVGAGAIVNVTSRPRIDVRATDVEQVFELAIPQAAIDDAVEEALR